MAEPAEADFAAIIPWTEERYSSENMSLLIKP